MYFHEVKSSAQPKIIGAWGTALIVLGDNQARQPLTQASKPVGIKDHEAAFQNAGNILNAYQIVSD